MSVLLSFPPPKISWLTSQDEFLNYTKRNTPQWFICMLAEQIWLKYLSRGQTDEFTSSLRVIIYSSSDLICTLLAWGVLRMCTVLGLTPLALVLLYRANLLFRLPRSPLGREPLYLSQRGGGDSKFSSFFDSNTKCFSSFRNRCLMWFQLKCCNHTSKHGELETFMCYEKRLCHALHH